MKLRKFSIENVRSFLDPEEFLLDGDISILIGPNGGGKTNLLDAISSILRRNLMQSWVSRPDATQDAPYRHVYEAVNAAQSMRLPKHSSGADRPQRIKIQIEVTQRDIDNRNAMKEAASKHTDYASSKKFDGVNFGNIESWDPDVFKTGDKLSYNFVDGAFQGEDDAANTFAQFLRLYELDALLRQEQDISPLSTPLLYLPVNRVGGGFTSSVTLSGHNEHDLKRTVDIATSNSWFEEKSTMRYSISIAAAIAMLASLPALAEDQPSPKGPPKTMGDEGKLPATGTMSGEVPKMNPDAK
jgi:putative ATP-dependent endonuclease of the OLD family